MAETGRDVRVLKAVVVGLAVLLVGGFLVILGTIVYRVATGKGGAVKTDAAVSSPRAGQKDAFFSQSFKLQGAERVAGATVADGRIVVHLVDDLGRGRLAIFDLASGAQLGVIVFEGDR